MVNPSRFKAVWKTAEEIGVVVERVRKKYPACQKYPIDILNFAEFDLQLEFRFAPIRGLGQDAFLYVDLSGIVFDSNDFAAEHYGNRLRFSVAHELGHYFLHDYIYKQIKFKTVEEWVDFINKIPIGEYQKIEWQADEFAGQFLMPLEQLVKCMDEHLREAEIQGYTPLGDEAVLEFISRGLQDDFGVSPAAVQTRLRRTKLWPPG